MLLLKIIWLYILFECYHMRSKLYFVLNRNDLLTQILLDKIELDKMANNFVQECINSRIYAVEKTLQIFRDKSFANEQKKKILLSVYT